MTAESLLVPVVGSIAGFLAWFAIPLLGFSLFQMIARTK